MSKYQIVTDKGTYEVETDDGGGSAPSLPPGGWASPPPTPNELKPDAEQEQNFWTSPHGFIRSGLRRIGGGIEHMAQPGAPAKYSGLSDILHGGAEALTPVGIGALGPALWEAPGATLLGLGTGATGTVAGGAAGRSITALAGGGPEAEQLGGDIGGLAGGGLGYSYGPRATTAALKAIPPKIIKGAGAGIGGWLGHEMGGVPGAIAGGAAGGVGADWLTDLLHPEEPAPLPPWQGFKAKPNIAARMPYDGPAETRYSPSNPIPRKGPAPLSGEAPASPVQSVTIQPVQSAAQSPKPYVGATESLAASSAAKDAAMAHRLYQAGVTPDKFTGLDDATINGHLRTLGYKPLGKGGALGRSASQTKADIADRLADLWKK